MCPPALCFPTGPRRAGRSRPAAFPSLNPAQLLPRQPLSRSMASHISRRRVS